MPHEHGHPHVAGEARRSHAIQIGLFVFFIIVWIADSFLLPFFWVFHTSYIWGMPIYLGLLIPFAPVYNPLAYALPLVPGVIIILLGVLVTSRSHIVFEVKEPKVVDYGLYARVRHPMYLGSILLYVGFWVTTLSLLNLIPLLVVIIGYNYLANEEEKLLIAKFGDQYLEYKKRVPKWLPH